MEIFFLSDFGKAFIPKRARPHLRLFFEKTGRDDVPYHTFGVVFWVAAFISLFIYLTQIYPALRGKVFAVFFIVTFIFFAGLMLLILFILGMTGYFYLNMRIYQRTKEMESMLSDYLALVSTSLKGGYSFERALWSAIKPEFGILAKEIGLVSKRVLTGNDVSEALTEFALKYDSPILRRSIDLIIGEVESGGKIVDVIERVIMDLKKTKALKEEMAANTLTYVIFISALVMFVMPVLFALSFLLFNVITGFLGNISANLSSTNVSLFRISKSGINPSDYKVFIVLAISIISVSSAIIVSIIEKGDMRAGLKYIPMFLITSLFIYFLFLEILGGLFGKLVSFG